MNSYKRNNLFKMLFGCVRSMPSIQNSLKMCKIAYRLQVVQYICLNYSKSSFPCIKINVKNLMKIEFSKNWWKFHWKTRANQRNSLAVKLAAVYQSSIQHFNSTAFLFMHEVEKFVKMNSSFEPCAQNARILIIWTFDRNYELK